MNNHSGHQRSELTSSVRAQSTSLRQSKHHLAPNHLANHYHRTIDSDKRTSCLCPRTNPLPVFIYPELFYLFRFSLGQIRSSCCSSCLHPIHECCGKCTHKTLPDGCHAGFNVTLHTSL
jgi:hypothetical protein